jgi:hypothetical protein
MQERNTSTQTRWSAWDYRDQSWSGREIAGYEIEAQDGSIGKVDDATHEMGGSYLIVDTGPWIFGKKVMLPAGVVNRIDHENHHVFVDRTKDQIKNAPEFDESRLEDMTYRDELGTYYGEGGRGWHDDSPTGGTRY